MKNEDIESNLLNSIEMKFIGHNRKILFKRIISICVKQSFWSYRPNSKMELNLLATSESEYSYEFINEEMISLQTNARLVAQYSSQRREVNYEETHSHVMDEISLD